MNMVAGSTQISQALQSLDSQPVQTPTGREQDVKQAFQDFVAGTFYKQMLKSLRKAQQPSVYFNGGQAEKIFQSQMDQQIAESLAHNNGAEFADPLFQTFATQINLSNQFGHPQQTSSTSSPTPESI